MIIQSSIGRVKVAIILYPKRCVFLRTEPLDDNTIDEFTDHITLYYRAFIVCGYARCKGW